MKRSNFLYLAIVCVLFCTNAFAEETNYLKKRLEKLEKRVNQLESEKSAPKTKVFRPVKIPKPRQSSVWPSRLLNPAISVNGLLLGTYVNEGNADSTRDPQTGLNVQEMELRFTSNIDSYLRGIFMVAFDGDAVEVEEANAFLLVTNNLSLRAGKFFVPFGKHSQLHTHMFPFIDAPLINEKIVGREGLKEVGIDTALLLPTFWFSEINFVVFNGDNALFNGALNDDFVYLAHWKNLVDIGDELTAELGGSFAYGKNELGSGPYNDTQLAGVDLTFKWRPAGRERYRTLIWQSEFINSSRDVDKKGVYSLAQFQFARRWWIQGRYDFFTIPRNQVGGGELKQNQYRYSTLLAFVLSEFSALRLQYNYLDPSNNKNEHQVLLQLNFTFGSHPAHAY